ncbi:MAG: tRNA pseudouridine(13) synthase TruD [Polyangiaceae bacterium]|nr:tRNA pseudouridine(13) synthase TruD [Polyangiaceae bacterium]
MRPTVTIRATPEDFEVEELPAYAPSGAGPHLFVRFRKRELDTLVAVRMLARRLGVSPRDAGTAGLKDRHAVTTQWASLPLPERAPLPSPDALSGEGIEVLELARHGNKLKTGHLRGNRFALALRDVPVEAGPALVEALTRIGVEGLPNRFGRQRFGRHGDNADRALAFMTGAEPAPRDPKVRRLLFSALQSRLFHEVLDARVADGTWSHLLPGDLVGTAGGPKVFTCDDPAREAARLAAGEVWPTGPLFGAKMPWPSGRPAELERAALSTLPDGEALLARWASLGEGARRALVLRPAQLSASLARPDCVRVEFVLARGAYATSVLDAVCDAQEPRRSLAETAEEEPREP